MDIYIFSVGLSVHADPLVMLGALVTFTVLGTLSTTVAGGLGIFWLTAPRRK